MPVLTLSLSTWLDTFDIPDILRPNGALFTRWVPDGQADSVRLSEDGEPEQLSVWFERRAKKTPSGFLEWDHAGNEFDVAIMERQGKLDGGSLRGELVLADVPEEAFAAMKRHPVPVGEKFGEQPMPDEPAYIALGKRIVHYAQPRLARFIDRLRTQYGQYWLREINPWDSRRSTLGSYCTSLGLKWWNEDLSRMCRFIPTDLQETITVQRLPGREYEEYLTQADWRHLQDSRCRDDISIELQLLGSASRMLDSGERRQQFVEVASALEIAISNRLRHPSTTVQSAMQRFLDGPLKVQVAVVLQALHFRTDRIEDALRVLDVRNTIVHEGANVSADDIATLRRVMQIVRELIDIKELKSPCLEAGNRLSPPNGGSIRFDLGAAE